MRAYDFKMYRQKTEILKNVFKHSEWQKLMWSAAF